MNFTSNIHVFRLKTDVGIMARTGNVIFCFLWCLQFCMYLKSAIGTELQEQNADFGENVLLDNVIYWECNSELDCVVSNTTCKNNTCQCPLGYIYNGEMTSCVKVAKFGESCEESRQCSTYLNAGGACIKNVCLCGEGYHYLHGRCNPYVGLFEKCRKDTDCYVNVDFNAAFCDEGICKCSPGFYLREYRTCRPEGKKVNDSCTIDNDCTFNSNAICVDFKCTLANKNNTEAKLFTVDVFLQNYATTTDANINITCTTDKDCVSLDNASCGPLKKCTCKRAYFFQEELQKCVPELGEACRATDKAAIEYSECRNDVWSCQPGRIISSDNQQCLKATRQYGYSCQMDIQCSIFGSDSRCVERNNVIGCECTGNSRFIESELFCWIKKGIGEKCQHDRDCFVDGINSTLSCQTNVCSCPRGTHSNNNHTDCIKDAAGLGEKCEVNNDCATIKNAACVNEVCICKDNYYKLNNQCVAGFNATCANNTDCKLANAECKLGRCSCKEKYIAASVGLCMPTVIFGKPCEKDVQCTAFVTNAICRSTGNSTTSKVCTCAEGYHNRFDSCNKIKVLGMSCDNLGECYLESNKDRVVCKKNECACNWGYERVNDTACKMSLVTSIQINGATTRSLSGFLPVLFVLGIFLVFN